MPTVAPSLSEVATSETFLAKEAALVRQTNWVSKDITVVVPDAGN
jgi:hypothetical protein